jgi:hypothetical protein
LREPYYITRCCCSWPLLLLTVVQGASRTRTITTLDAMAEVFSDETSATSAAAKRLNEHALRDDCQQPVLQHRPQGQTTPHPLNHLKLMPDSPHTASPPPQHALQTDAASAESLKAQDATERDKKKTRHQDVHAEHALTHHTLASIGHLASHFTRCASNYFPHLPSNAQGQNCRPPYHNRIKTPCRHTALRRHNY